MDVRGIFMSFRDRETRKTMVMLRPLFISVAYGGSLNSLRALTSSESPTACVTVLGTERAGTTYRFMK